MPEVRSRIIGCQFQMQTFKFFFGLHFAVLIYSHTDNLSKTLQKKQISASEGQHTARLTTTTLKSIRTEDAFDAFYEKVVILKGEHIEISEPVLPRRRHAPEKIEVGDGELTFPFTVKDHYRREYFEAFDWITSAIEKRFNQESVKTLINFEDLLLKSIKGESVEQEKTFVCDNYSDDVNICLLDPQLSILKSMISDHKDVSTIHDILQYLSSSLSVAEQSLLSEVMTISKLILVNPASTASGERSFSMARRLKTWLRARMSPSRFNSLALLNTHKDRCDKLDLVVIANAFVTKSSARLSVFGHFSEDDFK